MQNKFLPGKNLIGRGKHAAKELLHESLATSWLLIKIMIPVVVITRILEDVGLIKYLSFLLDPIMSLMGLPGELGLVWATGILTGLYGAIAVFASLSTTLDLTTAQVTVLGAVLLIAHALPVELTISKKAGAPFWPIALLRVFGAVIYGMILYLLTSYFSLWQEPAAHIFGQVEKSREYLPWAISQLENIGMIFCVISVILIFMKLLRFFGVIRFLEKLLNPVLPVFGMSTQAAPITVVGMILGLGYGGALIIRETAKGALSRKDIVNAMAFMALCHGLLEDTLLMVAIGGTFTGVFWGRIAFTLLVTYLLVKMTDLMEKRRLARQLANKTAL